MKSIYRTIIAAAGSFLAAQFGGWDAALETLVCFMAIDWITGGVLLPVVFKKSPKSENGTLESRAGWKGLCRKGMMLFFVLIAEKLDQLTQTNYLRDAVCIGFILNEAVSILENAGLMGVKIPEILRSCMCAGIGSGGKVVCIMYHNTLRMIFRPGILVTAIASVNPHLLCSSFLSTCKSAVPGKFSGYVGALLRR